MSGICGFCKNAENSDISILIEPLIKFHKQIQNETFNSELVTISQVELKEFIQSPYVSDDIVIYLEGVIFNYEDIKKDLNLENTELKELLAEAYRKDIFKQFLNKTNGEFCGCLYDITNEKIVLFTDRMGTGFIYYYLKDNQFAFSGKTCSLLNMKGIDKSINADIYEGFVKYGYIFGDNTWHKYIKLIKPASVIEFDVKSKKFVQEYYWRFSEIKPSNISLNDASKKLGQAFINSVERRFKYYKKYNFTVPISGGRDSRMIVAAINKIDKNYNQNNVTIGTKDCDDIIIAKQVCEVANQKHKIIELKDDENWFEERKKALIIADGSFHLQAMHGFFQVKELANDYSCLFSGYPAGEILYDILRPYPKFKNMRIDSSVVNLTCREYSRIASDTANEFYNINHIEPYLYVNKFRRYGGQNISNLNYFIKYTTPFIDNEITELLWSLPDEYILKGLYPKTLYETFHKFYKYIPWQRTGKTLDYEFEIFDKNLLKRFVLAIKRFIKTTYLNITKKQNKLTQVTFFDYANAIRKEPVKSELENLLASENSFASKVSATDYVEKYLTPHLMRKKNYTVAILNIASFEIYFREKNNDNTIQ